MTDEYTPKHSDEEHVDLVDTTKPFWMSDGVYKFLKWMAQIVLPAAATFYLTVGALWALPNPEKVAATVVAFDTFLGVILMLATKAYDNSPSKYDGIMEVHPRENGPTVYGLQVNTPIDQLDQKSQLVLKVNK